jgi:hypothetical protein
MKSVAAPNDAELVAEFIMGSHLTLAFLWVTNQVLLDPVKLTSLPELDNVDELCTTTLQQLRGESEL